MPLAYCRPPVQKLVAHSTVTNLAGTTLCVDGVCDIVSISQYVYGVSEMSVRFGCSENYLEVTDFHFHNKEADRGNPYNTTFSLIVHSCGFCGIAPCEYDIKDFISFVSDLHRLYDFEIDKVLLRDRCYGSEILFTMDRTGHLEVSGKIYGDCTIHTLEFCFVTDQTVLKSFLEGLDELLRKNFSI